MIIEVKDEDVDSFLEHYGRLGMKWGKRSGGGGGAGNASNRKLNKQSRSVDRAKRDKEIDKARTQIKSGKGRADHLKAKKQYKIDKVNLGSREAKKALNKVKDKSVDDYWKSQEAKSGKETTKALISTGAGIVLLSTLRARA